MLLAIYESAIPDKDYIPQLDDFIVSEDQKLEAKDADSKKPWSVPYQRRHSKKRKQ
jgi:hypothetical protein